jgi:polysaccharide export outer membrane protein
MKLITVAGGLAENHGSTAFIIRGVRPRESDSNNSNALASGSSSPPSSATMVSSPSAEEQILTENEKYELIKVRINGLFQGDFDKNMYLDPGSIIHIPRSEVFFVAGDVYAPGSFPYRDGTSLRQAISLAQGIKFTAASNRGIIFREDLLSRKRLEINIDIGAVMNGKAEDISIMANDVIIVPNSRSKTISGTLLLAFGVNLVTRFPGR